MDEEDYINDLGWNTADKMSEDEPSEIEASVKNEIKSTHLASPKQAVDPQPGTSKDYANKEELKSFDEKKSFKKLGRPPKSVYLRMQPTRGSTRLKKKPDILNIEKDNAKRNRTKWSEEDKRKFLTALEVYGPNDIKAISKVLINKTSCDVRNQIEFWKDIARTDYQQKMIIEERENSSMNTVAKLDAWLEYFRKLAATCSTTPFALSEVFILISEYGKFPPPEQCDGIDFRAMYRYLHCMLNGLPYFDLNPRTAQEINDNLKNMVTMIRDYRAIVDLNHHINGLAETPKNPSRWKNYGRQPCRGHVGLLGSELIMNLTHLNPLKIPPHLLTKPVSEKAESASNSNP